MNAKQIVELAATRVSRRVSDSEKQSLVDQIEDMQRSRLDQAEECERRAQALEREAQSLRDCAAKLRAS